jgi:hypothetical protein
MALTDVSSSDVIAAIQEFDELGRDAFLDKYGMSEARSYMLHHNGHDYDSKAILAAAHGHHPGLEPLHAAEFSGGDRGAGRYLRRLGFVVSSTTREPTWARDELSNEFQQLITQLLGEGAVVEQSKMLTDRISGEPREVDVVAEVTVTGHTMVVSIEVRDHLRPQGVEWIEQQYAKHSRLPTNLLILVSKSGFTRSALAKAASLGIKAITPSQVNSDLASEVAASLGTGPEGHVTPDRFASTGKGSKITIDEERLIALLEVAGGSRKPNRWVFVSYVRDDSAVVDQLCADLENAGVRTWRDIDQLLPGDDWKLAIRRAIEGGSGFIACFSRRSEDRSSSYMREELMLAIEQLRLRPADSGWFMPVLLDDVTPPDTKVGAGRTLRDLHFIRWEEPRSRALKALLAAIGRLR